MKLVFDASVFLSAPIKPEGLPELALRRATYPPDKLFLSDAVEAT